MTLPAAYTHDTAAALPLHLISKSSHAEWLAAQPAHVQAWLASHHFDGSSGSAHTWADANGHLAGAVLGVEDPLDPYAYAHAPRALPAGTWQAVTQCAATGLGVGLLPL
jgi:leucyl aminopeptidase